MSTKKKSLGVCLGASTVSFAQIESAPHQGEAGGGNTNHTSTNHTRVTDFTLLTHGGDPKKALQSYFEDFDPDSIDTVAVTGRRLHEHVHLSSIPEPVAVEHAYDFLKPRDASCPAVVSAGGETFMVYVLDTRGQISNVLTGNKCASGTGEFFLQQLRRMDVSLEDVAGWDDTITPYPVSGRCSVFCKSDCTHATNKGVPRSTVTAGLSVMMADKILELLKKVKHENIMIVGGSARNRMMIKNLQAEIPGLIVPEEAPYFEALGAALWAMDNTTAPFPGAQNLFKSEKTSFEVLPALNDFAHMVEFKTIDMADIQAGDACLLGLDVGSTTTKAVLLRQSDNALLSSVYLRTNGDPVGASRQCYRAILDQIKARVDPGRIRITGLGVCGSGRQIAGLHALSDGVINEIIAHAAAAVYFDPGVDTIFEIGGQDAKYTYITNGVSSDYAMNEACSAGTGSFLEESAFESLGVKMEEIADIALKGEHPPNFNDQCAAFIASDIKNAIHEGCEHEDIVAGLVYSICMNYSNRVKGNRPVGEKVFMQGGVCYNRAIPLAMASLVGKPIIVPPEPGLMGAFGVALEVKKRMASGLMEEKRFDLEALMNREVAYGKSFVCRGGKEVCDRRCSIAMIELEGVKYPFGGACNRYYNLRNDIKYDVKRLDLVRVRQQLIFEKYAGSVPREKRGALKGKIGMNRSFLVNTYFPLYSTFFAELGYETVLPDTASREGIDRRNAAFCYPGELAHGFFHTLLTMETGPEFIFLPHFKSMPSQNGNLSSQVCPFVQGEPFYMQMTFKAEIDQLGQKGTRVLSPLLDMNKGVMSSKKSMVDTAVKMGINRDQAEGAFDKALDVQKNCEEEMKRIGREALKNLESDPDQTAVVLFARSYNGFVEEANMGIPHKLASRGVQVIPFDFLPYEKEEIKRHMYWGMGQRILMAANMVEKHPQLYSTFITNFSCGPDSFVIGYFRSIMGQKPSLTLELDNHTADAGLETRIEAFLDIVASFRQLMDEKQILQKSRTFTPAQVVTGDGPPQVITSSGQVLPMSDPRVTLLFPSMGRLGSESIAAVFKWAGFNASVYPESGDAELKTGRANTSCKECLPLILTTGTLLNYVNHQKENDEILVYFMPTGSGPCRFGQYYIFMEDLVKRLELQDVAVFSLSSENGYAGLGKAFQLRAWRAVIISDVMEDIRSMILANASDPDAAMETFEQEWTKIQGALEKSSVKGIERQLKETSKRFKRLSMKRPPGEVPTIYLAGEIFVRRDPLSRRYLTEQLAEKGLAVICSPVAEWVRYADLLVDHGLADEVVSMMGKLEFKFKKMLMTRSEKRIKELLTRSGLVHSETIDVAAIVDNALPYISLDLPGEAILTVGSSISEVVSHACGVIAIGPFGCMPNRLAESILNDAMTREDKLAANPNDKRLRAVLEDVEELPFLAIESDGSPFPQLIDAKLEAFCLRAERLHQKMMEKS